MDYTATVSREGKHWLAEFPDCPGCQTFAPSRTALKKEAADALEGWLEAHLITGKAPPKPKRRAMPRRGDLSVRVPTSLAVALQVRWARLEKGLTQGQLAKLAKVSQQQIAKLEKPGENPTIATLTRVAEAAGMRLSVGFTDLRD
jgi:predicted RNase H-like HicB family nuclease/DNA-binding phage protein